MKRPRSFGEDLEDDPGEKGIFKDWVRRDQDPDRPSSHRRFYPKLDSLRKGSSSYDRSLDDDRRKRFEHESDGFDRRKGFDRYRDCVSSSPRSLFGGGNRLHRSESFSSLRREFPKGFRSERDRGRRELSSGSSWRRSSGGKEAVDELRSPSINSDSVGRGNHAAPEDRGKVRCRDSSSGEQSRRVETAKEEKGHKASCSSSEMEEGELEPDPEPETVAEPENCEDKEIKCNTTVSEATLEDREVLSSERKSGFDNEGASDEREEGRLLEMEVDEVDGNGNLPDPQNDIPIFKELNADRVSEREGEGEEEVEADLGEKKKEILEEESLSSPSDGEGLKDKGKDRVVEEGKGVAFSPSPSPAAKLEEAQGRGRAVETEVEARKEESTGIDLEVEQKEGVSIDLQAEPEGTTGFFSSSTGVVMESTHDKVPLKLMTDKLEENHKEKGKSLAISVSDKVDSMEGDNAMVGTSVRGFELFFPSDVISTEQANRGGVVIGKHKYEKPKLEPLDLSLGLPCNSSDHTSKNPKPNNISPSCARSLQSLPSSFRTISDGFTTSISFSGSQPFVHNPSCSLTQNSLENYEKSVGSRPIFQGMDQVSNGAIWQAQTSNEPKQKGGGGPLFQRVLLNSNPAHNSHHAFKGNNPSKPESLSRQSSLQRQPSPAHSHGSRDTRSENSKDKRLLTRERSSSNLFKGEQCEGEQLAFNGVGVFERIVSKIVIEPLQVTSKMLHEMTDHSVAYLRETICEMVTNADKHAQVHALREALQRRSDLTTETLAKCPRILLEILVALKTGLPDFLRKTGNISSSSLVEIFLDLKCRNLACQSILPVDECDCRVCVEKNGFCRECMCLVCSKFDMASNTCSWVGCDVCLHWCHTDCGLRESHIRNGRSASRTQEMQFHCIACDHPSEMFGFVKEVFKTFAKGWKAETLAKELQYVRRIFSGSDDARGRRLCDVADQMLMKLEDKSNLSEVINYVTRFLSESESDISNGLLTFAPKEPAINNAEGNKTRTCSSNEAKRLPSVSSDKVHRMENIGVISSMDCGRVGRQTRDAELQMNSEKKLVVDELESVVRFKQAEAKMYQERADDARREAEGLKRIAVTKNVKIEEDYATSVGKLRLGETEERRRQKLEELQVIERAHHQYFNMKMRMEADIKDLLLKMEATKRNFNT